MHFILEVFDSTGYILNNITVNGTNYEFKDKDLFRHRYTYIITGVNELGRGVSSSEPFSYQRGIVKCIFVLIYFALAPRARNASLSFGEYIQNNVTVNFTIPVRSTISF